MAWRTISGGSGSSKESGQNFPGDLMAAPAPYSGIVQGQDGWHTIDASALDEKPPGPGDPGFYLPPGTKMTDEPFTGPEDPRFLAIRQAAEHRGTAKAAPLAAAVLGVPALAAAGSAAGPLIASPLGRSIATTAGLEGFEKLSGVHLPTWLKAAAEVASGGSALKVGGRSLGKAVMGALLKGEFGAGAAAAAPIVAKTAAPIAAEAVETAIPAAAKVIQATVAGDKGFAVMDAAGKMTRFFRNAGDAVQFANTAKKAASVAEAAAPVVSEALGAAPAVAEAASAAPAVAKALQAPQAAMAAIQRFAKEAAGRNPKLGEKIWIALDKVGNPVRILTPDQAGAAKRAGFATTWIRNIWQ